MGISRATLINHIAFSLCFERTREFSIGHPYTHSGLQFLNLEHLTLDSFSHQLIQFFEVAPKEESRICSGSTDWQTLVAEQLPPPVEAGCSKESY